MKLREMTTESYLELLSSDAPAPGGGAVSALAAAQGGALTVMVCNLTIGREKYKEHEDVCVAAREKAEKICALAIKKSDEDSDAYNKVIDAFKLPKGTDEEKAARSKAIREATLIATEVPFSTMDLALDGLKNLETIVGKSNGNAASDIGVAALNYKAAAQGAWLNVKINLPGLKDEAKEREFTEAGEKILKAVIALADKLYEETEKDM